VTVGGALKFNVEVKTYLGRLIISDKVSGQIINDLVRHVGDDWEGLRYLFSPNVREELHVVKQAIVGAFTSPQVQTALPSRNLDESAAFETLLRRLDDTWHPMVDSYVFAVFN
jgi:hypothetical protein